MTDSTHRIENPKTLNNPVSEANALPRKSPGVQTSRSPLGRGAMLFVACCAGWYVMELEILGGRVLNIYFGSSIYIVWGSVIGVFLLSLSLGYMLGGWLSQSQRPGFFLAVNLISIWVYTGNYLPVMRQEMKPPSWDD